MKKIAFFVIGNNIVGMGHVHRVKILFEELSKFKHSCIIFHKPEDNLVNRFFSSNNILTKEINFSYEKGLVNLKYDVYILDILDTTTELVSSLKKNGKVISFEDIGEGAKIADMVINAMYPEKEIFPNHYYGYKYFEMREEFLNVHYKVKNNVENVLIAFGGVDPCNLTKSVLETIYDFCRQQKISINVIAGLGYDKKHTLESFSGINFYQQVNNIANFMSVSDIAFSSGGRTVYELACIGVPSVILFQNKREAMHLFASKENGFQEMGLGKDVNQSELFGVFKDIVSNYDMRLYMNTLMKKNNLKDGKKNVIKLLQNFILA